MKRVSILWAGIFCIFIIILVLTACGTHKSLETFKKDKNTTYKLFYNSCSCGCHGYSVEKYVNGKIQVKLFHDCDCGIGTKKTDYRKGGFVFYGTSDSTYTIPLDQDDSIMFTLIQKYSYRDTISPADKGNLCKYNPIFSIRGYKNKKPIFPINE